MSDTNRVKIAFKKQAGLGQIPANPDLQALRFTGAPDLAYAPSTVTSEEIRDDRQVGDLTLVGAQAGGSVPFELSYGNTDEQFEVALFNLWAEKALRSGANITDVAVGAYNILTGTAYAEGMLVRASGFGEAANNGLFRAEAGSNDLQVARTGAVLEASPPPDARLKQVGFEGGPGDIEADASGLTSTLLDFTSLGLSIGEQIKIGGTAAANRFDTAPNNTWVTIATISANAMTFNDLPTGWAADAGTGKNIQVWVGDVLRNGVNKQFMYLEETFSDHSPETYQYFEDMGINVLELSLPSQSIITGNLTFFGTAAELTETRAAGASDLPATTADVMNSSSNVGRIAEGGSIVQGKNYILELSINVNNNLRYQNAVGALGAIGIGAGECTVTGTLNTYFDDKTIAEQVINNTETSVNVVVTRNNQAYAFNLPRLKYSSGAPTVPGKNQDVTVNAEYQAILDPTFGYTIQIQRFEEYQQ